MHLRDNALLKKEMEQKLEALNSMGDSLSQPVLKIKNELGLCADKDTWKKTMKERMHEPEEETKKKEAEAVERVEKWKKQQKDHDIKFKE